MTNKSNSSDDKAESSEKEVKKEKVAEKLETLGGIPSDKKDEQQIRSSKVFPVIMVLLIALPIIAAVIYYKMPDEITRFITFDNESEQADINQMQPGYISSMGQGPAPQYPPQYMAQQPQHGWQSNNNPHQFKNAQKTEVNKSYQNVPETDPDDYMLNRTNTILIEKPQWVKDQELQMEQQRDQLQQQLDRQKKAMLEQQQAWAEMYNTPYNNRGNPAAADDAMNSSQNSINQVYPQNAYAYTHRTQPNPYMMHPQQQFQQPYQRPYNAAPQAYYHNQRLYYGPQPYATPYGWRAPVYR